MKTWKIPVTWEMYGVIEVEAETIEKAMEIARDDNYVMPLPNDGCYIDGSWCLRIDNVEYIKFYNILWQDR